jgi:hypothetical protein
VVFHRSVLLCGRGWFGEVSVIENFIPAWWFRRAIFLGRAQPFYSFLAFELSRAIVEISNADSTTVFLSILERWRMVFGGLHKGDMALQRLCELTGGHFRWLVFAGGLLGGGVGVERIVLVRSDGFEVDGRLQLRRKGQSRQGELLHIELIRNCYNLFKLSIKPILPSIEISRKQPSIHGRTVRQPQL